MSDELAEHLNALARDGCYRVDAVLKESTCETTERVYFQGANGAEMGPFVRKRIDCASGMGTAYELLCAAQRAGRRFRFLPRVHDCYRVGDGMVVVMEYVEGETLADAVYRLDASVPLALDVFPRLCDALAELHEGFDAPIIHRDLKPSNVMLSRGGLTIIDFGIARAWRAGADEDTRRFGTRAYASPEQFGFGQTDVRSDVYALGMLLYFCLTECTPDAKARAAGFADVRIPEPFRQVIARAAAFDPQARYASAAEAKRAFLAAADALGVPPADSERAEPPADPERLAPPAVPPVALGPAPASQCPPSPVAGFPAPATVHQSLRLSGFPFWLGVAWDVLLALLALLLVAAGVSVAVDPQPGSSLAEEPFARRALSVACVVLLMFFPMLFLLRDRRPLRRLFPQAPRVRLRVEAACAAGAFVACFLLVGLLGALFP